MKKYLVLFISVIILSLSLCIPSFALNKRVITLSEDYKYMYYNGATYTRADTSMLRFTDLTTYMYNNTGENYSEETYASDEVKEIPVDSVTEFVDYGSYYTVKLTKTQGKEIKKVEITNSSYDETLFYVLIYFYDGSELQIDFIREDLIIEYKKSIKGEVNNFYIDFKWPEGNKVTVNRNELFTGEKTKINVWDYDYDYDVYAKPANANFDIEIGKILKFDDDYYFYSFIDSDIKSSNDFWELDDEKIKVTKLEDESIIEKIKLGEEKREEDSLGYLYNDELKESVAKIFFILVFAIIPAVICIVSFILALKSKKSLYKKLLLTTSGISLAEIVTFIYIAFTLFNK